MDSGKKVNKGLTLFILLSVFLSQNSAQILCQLTKESNASYLFKLTELNPEQLQTAANTSMVSFTKKDNTIILKFFKSSISERDFFTYFSTGFFIIPAKSKIIFPDGNIAEIEQGKYTIEESILYYEVIFN